MAIVDGIGALVLAAALLLALLVVRRLLLTRAGGCLGISLRREAAHHRWTLGLGRLEREQLVWFRLFSLGVRPRHVIDRKALAVVERRRPTGAESLVLPADAVVFACQARGETLEVALPESTIPGFLAWLESAPPGASLRRRR